MGSGRSKLVGLAFVSCAMTSCVKPKLFTYPTGNIPLVVTNNNAYPICVFELASRRDHVSSWDPLKHKQPPKQVPGNYIAPEEPSAQIAPGETFQVGVDPDTYEVSVESCDNVYTGTTNLAIDGPTSVDLGPPTKSAPAGYRHVELALRLPTPGQPAPPDQGGAQQANCAPAGDTTAGGPDFCCSGRWLSVSGKRPGLPPHCAYDDE